MGTCILRNWFRSPWSMYSMITHNGCSTEHTPRTLAMFWSSRPAKILTSFCNSALKKRNIFIMKTETWRFGWLSRFCTAGTALVRFYLPFFFRQRGREKLHSNQSLAQSHVRVVLVDTVRFGHVNLNHYCAVIMRLILVTICFVVFYWLARCENLARKFALEPHNIDNNALLMRGHAEHNRTSK